MRFIFALKVFFRILTQPKLIPAITAILDTPQQEPQKNNTSAEAKKPAEAKKSAEAPAKLEPKSVQKPQPGRSDALTLLAAFQREARFIDFLEEDIQPYDDAQVGAIVRDIHRSCAQVVKRMFALKPAAEVPEGETITIQPGFDPLEYQFSGSAAEGKNDNKPITGTVVHSGWKAEKLDLPQWNGSKDAAMIIAPVEVEN